MSKIYITIWGPEKAGTVHKYNDVFIDKEPALAGTWLNYELDVILLWKMMLK